MKKILLIAYSIFIGQNIYSQTQLWGMTRTGGQYNTGVIFKANGSGNNETVQHSFFQYEGANPLFANLIQASDGMLYGMTQNGGVNGVGVIFQFDPSTNTYTKKIDFSTINGRLPLGSLMQASDGKLYGMTSEGGTNNAGVLFQFDFSTNTYTKKFDFSTANGTSPHGSLMQAADGNLYGMTQQGGANAAGVIFQYEPSSNTYTKKIDLSTANGSIPFGALMQASDGKLYGMTQQGGANSLGVLFQYDPSSNTYTRKIDLSAANGSNPLGSLIQTLDGKLYGMTSGGGVNGVGALFQYDPSSNTYTKKIDLNFAPDGNIPGSSLMQASDGKLYGMTSSGGANNMGVLFQYDPSTNTITKKFDFDGAANGSTPHGSLMQASDGMLYGMAYAGGTNGAGVIFQYNTYTNTYTKKIDLVWASGSYPFTSLIQASDGKLYGITTAGGANGYGVIFQYNPSSNTYIKKFDFVAATGAGSISSLIQASDGKLYGLSHQGGAGGPSSAGAIFQYTPSTNTYADKFDFSGTTIGSYPQGSLIQASDGKLYGMTSGGGANGVGALFQFNPSTSTCIKKFDFDGTTNGSNPQGSLMQAADGKLYGTTGSGGSNKET